MLASWLKSDTFLLLAFIQGGATQHSLTQPWKWLHGVLWQKTFKWACSPLSHRLCFGLLCSICNFHWKYCNFFTKNYNIFILACHTKFLILIVMIWSMIWSMICDLVCDPVGDPVRDPVRDPIQSNPIQILLMLWYVQMKLHIVSKELSCKWHLLFYHKLL